MKNETFNLFIVDHNLSMATGLRNYLTKRFGAHLHISTFYTGLSALEKVDEDTRIVILDHYLKSERGNDVPRSIKKINPKTEVIMLSSNEDMGVAIESFRNVENGYRTHRENLWKRIVSPVGKTVTFPVRLLVLEFGVNKYIAMFLVTFISMGLVVYFALLFFR